MGSLYDLVLLYAAWGGLVAIAFMLGGIEQATPSARGSYWFRPLLLPGLVLLWPVVLWRWWRLTRQQPEPVCIGRQYRALHLSIWLTLTVLLPLTLLLAISLRQEAPLDPAPRRLTPTEAP